MKERLEIDPPESAVSFAARLAHVGSFSQMTRAESSAGMSSLETGRLVFGLLVCWLTEIGCGAEDFMIIVTLIAILVWMGILVMFDAYPHDNDYPGSMSSPQPWG